MVVCILRSLLEPKSQIGVLEFQGEARILGGGGGGGGGGIPLHTSLNKAL